MSWFLRFLCQWSWYPSRFSPGFTLLFSRVSPVFFFRPASSVWDHIYISELSLTPSPTSQRSCFQPTYDFSVPASCRPPTWNGFSHYSHLFLVLLSFTVLISSVSCECPATMLSLSSSQTEPGYGRLAALLAMAGPSRSESVLMHKFRIQHLLLSQRENPRRVEWLLILRRNGRLSCDTTPQIQRG